MLIAMKRVIVLQHMDREGPGYIADLCRARGLRVSVVRLDEGATVPSSLGPGDALVVMGGSMGAVAAGSTVVERNLDRITIAVALVFTFATLTLDLRLQ